ncbi:MAG TPA: metallophosphoesterase [Vicinamibacterales bacterium]|nr:metallophosphoesterase [Vicinamibacterales bacterium]
MRVPHPLLALVLSIGVLSAGCSAAPALAHGGASGGQGSSAPAPSLTTSATAPREQGSVRLAIIGDSGTGTQSQYDVGTQMAMARTVFPFDFVVMLGDNIYGSERPQDFANKFEKPYRALLDAKLPFYASLGNHDDPTQRYYKPFNMNGERFYTFTKGDARFFALDSNYMDQPQLKWLEDQLSASTSRWKVAYFHHPLYSSGGQHGSDTDLRASLEPLFMKYGVDLVLAGHEHFYERLKPQHGIYYFISGGAAALRRGDIRKTAMTAAGFDSDFTFMLAELGKNSMQFQVLARTGKPVDSGTLPRAAVPKKPADDKPRSQ